MAYGTQNGVSNNLLDYAELIDAEAISEEMNTDCRTAADGLIDARLAGVITAGGLPMASPPALINSISDDLTTYYLLRRLFTGKDPNDSEWVDKFYVRPLELLEMLIANPQIIESAAGASPAEDKVMSSTPGQDRIFSVSRSSMGEMISDTSEGSMDEW